MVELGIYFCLSNALVDMAFVPLRIRISHEKPQIKGIFRTLTLIL